jgi:hypothetical protein
MGKQWIRCLRGRTKRVLSEVVPHLESYGIRVRVLESQDLRYLVLEGACAVSASLVSSGHIPGRTLEAKLRGLEFNRHVDSLTDAEGVRGGW